MPVTLKIEILEDGVTGGMARLEKGFPRVLDAAMGAAALRISGDAKRSLVSGAKTGRTYKRGSVTHQASAPGEAPASDTGDLLGHIFPESGRGFAFVGSTVLHGLFLEERPSSKGGRPWLFPATERDGDKIEADLLRRLNAL